MVLPKIIVVTALGRNAIGVFVPVGALEYSVVEFEGNPLRSVGMDVVGSHIRNLVSANLVALLILRVKEHGSLPGKFACVVGVT